MHADGILAAIEALFDDEREAFFTLLHQKYPVPILSPELKALLAERDAASEADPHAGYTLEEVVEYVKRAK